MSANSITGTGAATVTPPAVNQAEAVPQQTITPGVGGTPSTITAAPQGAPATQTAAPQTQGAPANQNAAATEKKGICKKITDKAKFVITSVGNFLKSIARVLTCGHAFKKETAAEQPSAPTNEQSPASTNEQPPASTNEQPPASTNELGNDRQTSRSEVPRGEVVTQNQEQLLEELLEPAREVSGEGAAPQVVAPQGSGTGPQGPGAAPQVVVPQGASAAPQVVAPQGAGAAPQAQG